MLVPDSGHSLGQHRHFWQYCLPYVDKWCWINVVLLIGAT